jgi:hypothetical protein
VINPLIFSNIGFDPIKDFAPITKLSDSTLVLLAQKTAGQQRAGTDRVPRRHRAFRSALAAPAAPRISPGSETFALASVAAHPVQGRLAIDARPHRRTCRW